MSLRNHQIRLQKLRKGEKILHNCTSHWLVHLKLPTKYVLSLIIPMGVLMYLSQDQVVSAENINLIGFLFGCYALISTTYFFVLVVNFQLGGCVITTQRVLRFGYRGLFRKVEREILPQKIEDVRVENRSLISILSEAAFVFIHTSNNAIETLKDVTEPQKIQELLSEIRRAALSPPPTNTSMATTKNEVAEKNWIEESLAQDESQEIMEKHRGQMIGKIGSVLKKKKK